MSPTLESECLSPELKLTMPEKSSKRRYGQWSCAEALTAELRSGRIRVSLTMASADS